MWSLLAMQCGQRSDISNTKQYKQCICNVTLRRVRTTIVAVEKQWFLHILSVFVSLGIQHGIRMLRIAICGPVRLFGIFSALSRKLRENQPLASSCLPFRPSACINSLPTGRTFMKFYIWAFFWKSFHKIQVALKSDKSTRYFTWGPIYIFNHISLSSS